MNRVYFHIMKSLVCIIVFLGLGIFCKLDSDYKESVYRKVYQEHLEFSQVKAFYNKYLGGIMPLEGVSSGTKAVFNEKLNFKSSSGYLDGVILEVDYNYLVPVIENGIVVFIGEKELYGNVIIVEGDSGISTWYGNICNGMVKIYDVIDKGSYLGEVCENKLFVAYTKGGEFLNYQDYLEGL